MLDSGISDLLSTHHLCKKLSPKCTTPHFQYNLLLHIFKSLLSLLIWIIWNVRVWDGLSGDSCILNSIIGISGDHYEIWNVHFSDTQHHQNIRVICIQDQGGIHYRCCLMLFDYYPEDDGQSSGPGVCIQWLVPRPGKTASTFSTFRKNGDYSHQDPGPYNSQRDGEIVDK